MKLVLSWLNEYVDCELSGEELAEKLTFSGTEVEAIRTVGGAFPGLIVGEIVAAEPLPNSERLRLCRVSDGHETLPVVCGADNATAGAKIAFAPPGSTLPNGTAIGETTLAGTVSRGMICAEDELALSDDHSGVLILPPDARPGAPLAEILGEPETVLDLEVTWNRPDCLSVIGMAREVAALLGRPLRRPAVTLTENDPAASELVRVDVEDTELCPRYVARVLTGLRPGPAPFWMRRRLSLSGVRAISAIVDVTNYVLLECGQPLHAFDAARLAERRIVVRRARPNERMLTLDEAERALTPDMLVIADAEQAVAVAGVMGGAGSEIGPDTRETVLESAWFDPASVRSTSARLGLNTEASRRFERGIDPAGTEWASRRAAALLAEHAGGMIARGAVDVFPGGLPARSICCRFERVRSVTGMDIADDAVARLLGSLELPVTERTAVACVVTAPSFRPDLEEEADLIEEVARLHGLDKVPTVTPSSRVTSDASDHPFQALSFCRQTLVGLGLTEIMNYSFLAPALPELFGCAVADTVALPNPVSADQSLMRHSLIPQMAETLARNLARQNGRAALFEIGRVFRPGAKDSVGEETRLAIGLMGAVGQVGLRGKTLPTDADMFLAMKGLTEALAGACHVGAIEWKAESPPFLAPGAGLGMYANGKRLGGLGLLRRELRAEWRMRGPVAVAEFATEPLLEHVFRLPELNPLPIYPAVERDMAVVADEATTHGQIEEIIRRHAPDTLVGIELFDIFRSAELGSGKKSLAYAMTYRSSAKTLTDEEVNLCHETIRNALRETLGVGFRE